MKSELDGRGGSEVVSSEEISKGKIPTFYQRRKKSKEILFFFSKDRKEIYHFVYI